MKNPLLLPGKAKKNPLLHAHGQGNSYEESLATGDGMSAPDPSETPKLLWIGQNKYSDNFSSSSVADDSAVLATSKSSTTAAAAVKASWKSRKDPVLKSPPARAAKRRQLRRGRRVAAKNIEEAGALRVDVTSDVDRLNLSSDETLEEEWKKDGGTKASEEAHSKSKLSLPCIFLKFCLITIQICI